MTATKTRSALRASLKAEDASIEKRLPESTRPPKQARARRETVPPAASKDEAAVPKPKKSKPTRRTAVLADAADKSATVVASDVATTSLPAAAKSASAKSASAKPPKAKPANKKTPAAKPVTPERIPAKTENQPAASPRSADPQPEPIRRAVAQKAGKVVRGSFSMPKGEHAALKTLRSTLAMSGRISTKSELLRAGIRLLSAEKPAVILRLLDELPVVPKGKARKKK